MGHNYKDHTDDPSTATFPVLFPKFTSTLLGPADDIILPPESTQVDFEGDLAVIIGKTGRRVAEKEAMDHVLGYCVSNDITMRDYQNKSPSPGPANIHLRKRHMPKRSTTASDFNLNRTR